MYKSNFIAFLLLHLCHQKNALFASNRFIIYYVDYHCRYYAF